MLGTQNQVDFCLKLTRLKGKFDVFRNLDGESEENYAVTAAWFLGPKVSFFMESFFADFLHGCCYLLQRALLTSDKQIEDFVLFSGHLSAFPVGLFCPVCL